MPLTVTETVSMEPEPLGPSISEVDSVRRSLFVGRVRGRVGVGSWWWVVVFMSQGIGVRAAPPIKSSSSSLWVSLIEAVVADGGEEPLWSRPLVRLLESGEEMDGSGKTDKGLETEMTRSTARRYEGRVR